MRFWNSKRAPEPEPFHWHGQVVGVVSGGEPIEGCEVVQLIMADDSITAMEDRARSLGVWHPHYWAYDQPSSEDADRVLDDERRFIWRAAGADWQPSSAWPGN